MGAKLNRTERCKAGIGCNHAGCIYCIDESNTVVWSCAVVCDALGGMQEESTPMKTRPDNVRRNHVKKRVTSETRCCRSPSSLYIHSVRSAACIFLSTNRTSFHNRGPKDFFEKRRYWIRPKFIIIGERRSAIQLGRDNT